MQNRTNAIEITRGLELKSKQYSPLNEKVDLSELFGIALSVIELMLAHFAVSDESFWEQSGIQDKGKRKSRRPSKGELLSQSLDRPTIHIVHVIANAGRLRLPKAEYSSQFGPIHQAWSHPDCRFRPSVLHRLFLRLLKAGTIEEFENVYAAILNERRFTN